MTEILEIIKSHSEKCDNKCGFKFTDLVNLVDLPIEELKSQL